MTGTSPTHESTTLEKAQMLGYRPLVHQWVPPVGIALLKSWKPDWHQGAMAPYSAAMRSQRKTIAEEYATGC